MTEPSIQGNCCLQDPPRDPVEICLEINERAAGHPLYQDARKGLAPGSNLAWRLSPEPFCISKETYLYLKGLGNHLLKFYEATNRLYFESVKGQQPAWIHRLLDQGKPEALVDYGRMNRFKRQLPTVIRPDLLFTESGRAVASELDSIPGGLGFVASLSHEYARLGFEPVGGAAGMVEGFAKMMRAQTDVSDPTIAIVVSEEASDYWHEFVWLGEALCEYGLPTYVVRPQDLRFSEEAFEIALPDGQVIMPHILYRYFELFDLKNIPKMELIQYANKKQRVFVTPPFKAYLEEKLLFALFHHPMLRRFWLSALGDETCHALDSLIPRTWILDPTPLPPQAVIPGLEIDRAAVNDFRQLLQTTKKQRDYVVKPSGFSELAWGSRGVAFGSDLSSEDWERTLQNALASFEKTPYLLQEYHKPAKVTARYYDFHRQEIRSFDGRARLCPYYFVSGDQAEMGGILVTVCPADKKAIHGMVDSIMVPARVE